MDSHDVVNEHRAAGRRFEAAGISSTVAAPPGAAGSSLMVAFRIRGR
jgi:hypothetical protein